ncbi:rare lipoprotein A [Rhizobium sp. RU20A]|nr:rare lipoprotein A [Rhizobium sp. RU20A]
MGQMMMTTDAQVAALRLTARLGLSAATGMKLGTLAILCIGLAACKTTETTQTEKKQRPKEYFAESVYGVKASPRVAEGKNIPKGGGRFQTGKPYQVKGKWYTPKEEPGYSKVGMSSWYGAAFHGRLTANGEVYDKYHLSAAHPTFPLPSYARVTNTENGTSVIVRVNDRGPYEYGRIIDVSSKTADLLDMKRKGTAKVKVDYIGRAPLEGNDMPYLMASYVPKGSRVPGINPEGQIASGVMVASNEPASFQARVARDASSGNLGTLVIPKKSNLDSGVPVTALAEAEGASFPNAVFSGADGFAALPAIGPIPRERPGNGAGISYASAYLEVQVGEGPSPFDLVLGRQAPLTEDAIRAHAQRASR